MQHAPDVVRMIRHRSDFFDDAGNSSERPHVGRETRVPRALENRGFHVVNLRFREARRSTEDASLAFESCHAVLCPCGMPRVNGGARDLETAGDFGLRCASRKQYAGLFPPFLESIDIPTPSYE